MNTNYHTHTYRCGHAVGSEREYVEKAIELGFTTLGFSEHAPMPFPCDVPKENLDRLLAMRMKTHEAEEYFNILTALREEYKNDIELHIGLEVEYFEGFFDKFIEYIKDYPVEYLILGQHFGNMYEEPMFNNTVQMSSDVRLQNYVDTIIRAIETDKITYIAHPDVVFYRRSLEVYEGEMSRLINAANERKIPLEINLYGLQEVRNYPTNSFWQLANEIGCDVVIGSDAHRPENLLNPFAVKYAELMLKNFKNLNLIERVEFKAVK